MSLRIANLFAAASVLAIAIPAPAHAASIITETFSGLFDSGTDALGWFGASGADLTGVAYSFTIYYRPSDRDYYEGSNGDFNVSQTWASGFIGDLQFPFARDFQAGIDVSEDESFQWGIGAAKWGRQAEAYGYVNGECCGNSYPDNLTYVYFPGGQAEDLNATHVRGMVSALPSVPEPATWLMMLLGFGAIGSMARRSRKPTVAVSYA